MKSTTVGTVSLPLMDINEVAARINISVRHVRRLVAEKRIPYLKVGSLLRFSSDEVEAWVDGSRCAVPLPIPLEQEHLWASPLEVGPRTGDPGPD